MRPWFTPTEQRVDAEESGAPQGRAVACDEKEKAGQHDQAPGRHGGRIHGDGRRAAAIGHRDGLGVRRGGVGAIARCLPHQDGSPGNTFGDQTAVDPLFDSYLASAATDTLNNVAAGSYTLYLYSENGGPAGGLDDRGAVFSLNGGLGVPVTNDLVTSTPTLGVNYIEFLNVTPVNGTITFSYAYNPADIQQGGEADFNGVQLVSSAAVVPEPTTNCLLMAGGVALLLVGWRSRAQRS